jgi:hypothetical protein
MKTLLTLLLLICNTFVYAQDRSAELEPDSLAVIELEFETLTAADIKSKSPVVNTNLHNVVTYQTEDGSILSYYIADKNKWISVVLPFGLNISDVKFINLDKKGSPELIIKGGLYEYGTGGGMQELVMIILTINNIPKQIFKVSYGYVDESFGDKSKDGEGGYYRVYERKISVTEHGVIILPNIKRMPSFVRLTKIPSGTYAMKNGLLRKIK